LRVGIDTFTIHELKLDAFAALDFVAGHGLEGAQFGGIRWVSNGLDEGRLREIRSHAERLGLYTEMSVGACNPHLVSGSLADHKQALVREVEAAAKFGWRELHTSLGGPDDRYRRAVSWQQQLEDSVAFMLEMAPVLRANGCRVNLETHGDTTTFELVRIAERVGPDVAGICLDTANVLCFCEDPVEAARRAAPYTHMTHTKDCIIFLTDDGYRRQVRPPGRGCLDWERIIPILGKHCPGLPLSIEDHKWWFDVPVFKREWLAMHPDLTREELAEVMRIAHRCEERIRSGEMEKPEEYEKIPMLEQLEERLASGRDYLRGMLDRFGLHG
jgi:sugar phosphate isomerase/epimerase